MDTRYGFTRRKALAAGAAVATSFAGCLASGTSSRETPVFLLAAGSLNNALENGLRPSLDVPLEIEAHGSAQVARLVADGQKAPDIVSLADVALFDGPLHPAWYAEFATNSLVISYDPASEGGKRIAAAGDQGWFRPLLSGEVSLGRTDPDVDPLGYRTLFMLELATRHYDTDENLREAIPDREQIYPETQLVSQFETGSIDAAVTYRNMAVERDYSFINLPTAIDLSDPAAASEYETARYTLPDGKEVRGGVISYGATIPAGKQTESVASVFAAHTTGSYLHEFGFTVPENYPTYTGDVPDALDA
ncbi:extracellular solute-binding protein [Haladaptatus sp. CMSO5]|uniref:extracellular solute-binding protein n=1 Tax=Haladaptatus sp. CMSO5 TaxID=3120514 RepID=UPI002FCE2AFA